LTANVVSWLAAVFMLAALTEPGALRLILGRQRQQALKAMVPVLWVTAVLVTEHGGLGGCCMRAGLRSRLRHSSGGS
jgi:hypothetical protein